MSSIYNSSGDVIEIAGGERIDTFDYSAPFSEVGSFDYGTPTYFHTQRVPVSEGDTIEYSGRVKSSYVCRICDRSGNVLLHSNEISAASSDSGTLIAPKDAAYAEAHTMNSSHSDYIEHEYSMIVNGTINITELESKLNISKSGTGNFAIRCAKEHSFTDGSSPQIEYFLLEEAMSGRFFFSRDLSEKKYAFTFFGSAEKYSFGILANGDVIAVRDAATLNNLTSKDDTQRMNPFVFLASENWQIQHEVDFGDDLKPCGWLENCGFRTLPNGISLFCEYTRRTVATANVWKIVGNITQPSNWVVKKSFEVTTTDDENGFKHCHSIMHDQFTNIAYLSTGDADAAAAIYYSTDSGDTWTQIGQYSEKYCRTLNFIFTEDYIYWATDSSQSQHYLFKAERDANGILDWDSIVDYIDASAIGVATYGIAYLPEIDGILLYDRSDWGGAEGLTMGIRIADLRSDTLHTAATVRVTEEGKIGFRTRFSEWYPKNCLARVGFDVCLSASLNDNVNHMKVCGNGGSFNNGMLNINNLAMQIYRTADGFGINFSTYYL